MCYPPSLPRSKTCQYLMVRYPFFCIPAFTHVTNLCVILDIHYTMSQQVSRIVQSSTYKLRLINVIRIKLTKPVAERVVNAMVTNNLDYCNSLLYGISGNQLLRIQRIQNTAARLILVVVRLRSWFVSVFKWKMLSLSGPKALLFLQCAQYFVIASCG